MNTKKCLFEGKKPRDKLDLVKKIGVESVFTMNREL